MAMSVDCIHPQYHKENVADIYLDEESKEFQKLSLNDVPQVPKKEESKDFADFDVVEEESKEFQKLLLNDVPQVPKSGKPLEQKPTGDYLYQDFTDCLAPYNYSPFWDFHNSQPKMHSLLRRHKKPDKGSPTPSTYSPLNTPDWPDNWDYKAPKNVEEYVRISKFFEDRAMFSVTPQK